MVYRADSRTDATFGSLGAPRVSCFTEMWLAVPFLTCAPWRCRKPIDYSDREMQSALEVNIPNYASAIVTADEIVVPISTLAGIEVTARP